MFENEFDDSIRRLCGAGEFELATARILRQYGTEIRGFLRARSRNEADASDAFGSFCESLWCGLPGFEWRCPVRVWSFKLARHAYLRFAALERRYRERAALVEPSDNTPEPAPSTDIELERLDQRLRRLQSRLPDEDRELVRLRAQDGLPWLAVAKRMQVQDSIEEAPDLQCESARLRKRFQLVKARLKRWAQED